MFRRVATTGGPTRVRWKDPGSFEWENRRSKKRHIPADAERVQETNIETLTSPHRGIPSPRHRIFGLLGKVLSQRRAHMLQISSDRTPFSRKQLAFDSSQTKHTTPNQAEPYMNLCNRDFPRYLALVHPFAMDVPKPLGGKKPTDMELALLLRQTARSLARLLRGTHVQVHIALFQIHAG